MGKFKFLLNALVASAVVVATMASCKEEVEPTELSEEAMSTKATVKGFVQYQYSSGGTSSIAEVAPKGTVVFLECTVKNDTTTVTYTKEALVGKNGDYTANLFIPTGQKASVRVYSNFTADDYATQWASASSSTVAKNFFGEKTVSVAFGQTVVCSLVATADGTVDEAFFDK